MVGPGDGDGGGVRVDGPKAGEGPRVVEGGQREHALGFNLRAADGVLVVRRGGVTLDDEGGGVLGEHGRHAGETDETALHAELGSSFHDAVAHVADGPQGHADVEEFDPGQLAGAGQAVEVRREPARVAARLRLAGRLRGRPAA